MMVLLNYPLMRKGGGILVIFVVLLKGALSQGNSVPHAVAVDSDTDEEALAEMLRKPHPARASNFEMFMSMGDTKGADEWHAQRKLQEVQEMKHWTEVTYGIPYDKDAPEWVDPLSDTSKPINFGFNADNQTAEEVMKERAKSGRGRSLAEEEVERRSLRLARIRKSLGLGGRGASAGPTLATLNGSMYRWDSTDVSSLTYVNWRDTNAITVVKTQGACASCWAIAAADTISMMNAINNGAGRAAFWSWKTITRGDPQYGNWGTMDVSVQQLCDCGQLGTCCQGGWPETAFLYALQNGGVNAWQSYPYIQSDSTCKTSLTYSSLASITGWELVPANDPVAARKAVAQQPYLAFISGSSPGFQTYLGGLYTGDCDGDLDHVVVVVGYGVSSQGPYWIIKNSWGTAWGDNGYMYLAASASGPGKCNIHLAPGLYPTNYPTYSDPCSTYPNPCGAGTCYTVTSGNYWFGTLTRRARCGCPAGFVENNQTSPSKCVTTNPCGANPNPCGSGTCTNLKDGSYACNCPTGYLSATRTDGASTCAPNNLQGGANTIVTLPGTTPEMLASDFNTSVSALTAMNPWLDLTTTIAAGAAVSLNITSACVRTYIVQAKDTCDSVAATFGILKQDIININPLMDCTNLLPGTEMCLRSLPTTSIGAAPPVCGRTQQVQPGDTCASIQQATGVSSTLFTQLNDGVKCDQPLIGGMTVCIAAGGGPDPNCTTMRTVQHGESCATIALSSNLTQSQFLSINKGFRCTIPYLQVGQQVCIDSPSLIVNNSKSFPYLVRTGDTIDLISQMYMPRCGQDATVASICNANALLIGCSSTTSAPAGTILQVPCSNTVGRSCGCAWDYDPYFGADGQWYQNYCDANCNYALPAISYQDFCRRACLNRVGLAPYNDPNGYCSNPCPWPQWNPQPSNWWWFANSFNNYYIGACQDWCGSAASTLCNARGDCNTNWGNYYNGCVANCRYGKC